MKLEIKQEHIATADAAKKHCTNDFRHICPVAQALKAEGYYEVEVGRRFATAVGYTWSLDEIGTKWINNWDKGYNSGPITLELEETV